MLSSSCSSSASAGNERARDPPHQAVAQTVLKELHLYYVRSHVLHPPHGHTPVDLSATSLKKLPDRYYPCFPPLFGTSRTKEAPSFPRQPMPALSLPRFQGLATWHTHGLPFLPTPSTPCVGSVGRGDSLLHLAQSFSLLPNGPQYL